MRAACRWNSRCIRSSRTAAGRPRRSIAISRISGLVEILHGYPIDAVVLTTGCDKTTPAQIMAASTVDIPAIVLSGGPMLDGWHDGDLVGSGTVIWRSRRKLAAGQINEKQFLDAAAASAPSLGHCNTMGTASTMNAVAEVLGLSLPGCAAIPAPYRERGQISYETGRRIVELAYEDLRPSKILTRAVLSQCHHRDRRDWRFDQCATAPGRHGAPRGHRDHAARLDGIRPRHSAAREHAAGGQVPGRAIPSRRRRARRAQRAAARGQDRRQRAHGHRSHRWRRTCSTSLAAAAVDRDVITTYEKPVQEKAGFLVLKGNLFDFAIMKTSVISPEFRKRYLGDGDSFECRAVVFDGSTDYHDRINDPALGIDEHTILVIRGSGPLGWPGSAEVVNMQPPDALLKRGIMSLPTLGDGRQSGTSDSPSILNCSPESAAGGGLAWLRTGDRIRIDLAAGTCDMLVSDEEIARRKTGRPAAGAGKRDAVAGAVSLHRRATRQRCRHGNGGEISRRRTEDAAPQSLDNREVLMSPPRLTEASLHAVRSGTILPTYDRGAHALRHRAHRAGRISSRASGVLRRHAAAFGQALGDLRVVAQEHRAARCTQGRSRVCTRWWNSVPRRARASSAPFASCWWARRTPTRHSRVSPRAIHASCR